MTTKHPHTYKLYRTKDGRFEYGYVRRKDLMQAYWVAQYMGDGQYQTFDTKAECLEWIRSWDDIAK